jgi:hypothetical protein
MSHCEEGRATPSIAMAGNLWLNCPRMHTIVVRSASRPKSAFSFILSAPKWTSTLSFSHPDLSGSCGCTGGVRPVPPQHAGTYMCIFYSAINCAGCTALRNVRFPHLFRVHARTGLREMNDLGIGTGGPSKTTARSRSPWTLTAGWHSRFLIA